MQAYSKEQALLIASITGSSALSGILLALSYISIPTILSIADLPESTLIALWQSIYFRGFRLSPPLALSSGLACLANTFLLPLNLQRGGRTATYLLTTAAVLNISVIPFTILFVSPTNRRLMARGAHLRKLAAVGKETVTEDKTKLEETRALCAQWATLNYVRMLLPFGGMVLAWLAW